jgi:5-methylcytosine-specific restriction protein B
MVGAVEAAAGEVTVEQAIEEFDPSAYRAFEHEAEEQRKETLQRYPREHWPRMTLEEYAQGQDDHPDNYCVWIERQTDQMGSIRGGSARKLIVYKHRNKPGWHFPQEYQNEQAAWAAVRDGFIRAFERADDGQWDDIDELEPLSSGAALTTKVLWTYFPNDLLPITSSDNLRHFLRIVGRDEIARDQSIRTIRLNRELLAALRSHPKLADASTKALERLLYMRFSPFEGRVVKVAPGESARFWPECRAEGYICVGWEEVGDLRQYESKDAFLTAFRLAYGDTTPSKVKEKADEVWLLLDLGVGERVVANKGTKEILAVGTVESPGYMWNPDRETHNHTVKVRWDESFAKEIPPQQYWAFKTVMPLSGKLRALVLGEEHPGTEGDEPAPPTSDEEPLFKRIEQALERKNQAILYGPPGTGKTWHASGFARWWLERRNAGLPATQTASAGTGDSDPDPALEWVTFHPSYSYEDFIEGFRPTRTSAGVALDLEDGIFKTMCKRALEDAERSFLLVIDEINRANVTKVLGELITLIEKDKRGKSTQDRYAVRLPYSKDRFVIPPNLFVLGTMNTADRSIKMLDTALRRRFGFVELMPDPALLASRVGGLRLDHLLLALNKRVARGAGREKQIGHSFFLQDGQPITDETEFADIFRDEIVPLLQEYAVDDYDELVEYLGPKIIDSDALTLDSEVLNDPSRLLEALEEHLLARLDEA